MSFGIYIVGYMLSWRNTTPNSPKLILSRKPNCGMRPSRGSAAGQHDRTQIFPRRESGVRLARDRDVPRSCRK